MRFVGWGVILLVLSFVIATAAGKWLAHINRAYDQQVFRHPDRWKETR